MKPPVIYLSGKISGLETHVVDKKFKYFKQELEALDYEVINPVGAEYHGNAATWEEYLVNDILIILDKVDALFALYDWENSQGAKLELALAKKLKLPIYYSFSDIPHASNFNETADRAKAGNSA